MRTFTLHRWALQPRGGRSAPPVSPPAGRDRRGNRRRRLPPCVSSKPERDGRIRLNAGAIEHPRVTRSHPNDPVGLHAVGQQPHDPVGGGLPGPHDHVAVRHLRQPGELIGGNDAGVISDTERRGCRRRDRRRQVGGVDDAASHLDPHRLARHSGRHEMRGAVAVILAPS
jgi:hypothetical protein